MYSCILRLSARQRITNSLIYTALMLALVAGAEGQSAPAHDCAGPSPCLTTADDPALTMFRHPEASRYWISGQDNVIFQYHPSFDAKYSGPKSLHSHAEDATSHVSTLYLGYA